MLPLDTSAERASRHRRRVAITALGSSLALAAIGVVDLYRPRTLDAEPAVAAVYTLDERDVVEIYARGFPRVVPPLCVAAHGD